MNLKISKRLQAVPPYPFAEFDKKKRKAIAEGKDVISLGVGDPDLPTPAHIVKAGCEALADAKNHQYPFGQGLMEFRKAIAEWYQNRFGVRLNPETEIHSALGSKDALSHFHLAFVNPGDIVLVPDPGYPVYNIGTIFTDGESYFLPLRKENNFLPDLDAIPESVLSKAKILFLNFPNNPTSAVADKNYFEKVISLAKKYGFIVAHDAAYSEIYFEEPPLSFLSVPGAKEVGVEFHSCSKTYNMTGWRIGWFCGNAEMVAALGKVKDNFDSGVFQAIQIAAASALTGPQDCVAEMRKIYRERKEILVPGLRKLGWSVVDPKATFYVWAEVPKGYTSMTCAEKMLEEAHVVSIPGTGFGKHGEGYLRFAFTVSKEKIQLALERISKINW